MVDFYLISVCFFTGYFVAQLPKAEKGEPWWLEWLMPLICAIAALIWPIILATVFVLRRYEMKRRGMTGG